MKNIISAAKRTKCVDFSNRKVKRKYSGQCFTDKEIKVQLEEETTNKRKIEEQKRLKEEQRNHKRLIEKQKNKMREDVKQQIKPMLKIIDLFVAVVTVKKKRKRVG